ncbi:MAG: TIGR03435 family protein [Acidobacteriota bacterium]
MKDISYFRIRKLGLGLVREALKPEPLGMAAPGVQLAQRIRRMLCASVSSRISSAKVAAVALTCSVVVVVFAAGTLVRAQPSVASSAKPPAFEVASIKPNNSGETRVSGGYQPGGRYSVTNYSLRALIAAAYVRPQVNPDFLIAGGPKWMDSDRFDVEAKAAGEFPGGPDGLSAPRRVMLQGLLADRFGLKVHHEKRQGPVYSLNVVRPDGRLGPKLRVSSADCATPATPPAQGCFARIGPGSISSGGMLLAQFISLLPRFVDRVVVDSTMLTGRYDMDLSWTPAPGEWVAPPIPGGAAPATDGPSLFTAIQEQLGLKLQPQTGPVDMLVIDDAHQPSGN